jgi:hypothetical protein
MTDEHPDPTGPEAAEGTRATDGTPDNVRSLRQQVDAETDKLAREQADMDADDGLSIEERAEKAEAQKLDEEKDGQFAFLVEEKGKTIAFKDLVKRGTEVEVRYKLTGQSIPNVKGGLMDPFATGHLLAMDAVVDSAPPSYIRDGEGRVEKIVVTMILKPRVVQQAFSEAGIVLIQEAAKREGVLITIERTDAAAA